MSQSIKQKTEELLGVQHLDGLLALRALYTIRPKEFQKLSFIQFIERKVGQGLSLFCYCPDCLADALASKKSA